VFTQATRDFGIWKADHPSHGRHSGSPTLPLLVALGMCAFVCWLSFFLALKIRSEFFVLENSGLALARTSRMETSVFEGRQAALRFGVRRANAKERAEAGEGVVLLFESGELLRYPQQENKITVLAQRRVSDMHKTGLLTLIANPAISRLQIWPEATLAPSDVASLLRFFTSLGFDDFDFALEVE